MPPVEAFGGLPKAEFGRLSPDGKYLALIKPIDGREKVAFLDLTNPGAPPLVVGMQDALAGDVIWKNKHLAICVFHTNLTNKWDKKDLNSWSRALGVDVDKKTQALLMFNGPYLKLNHDVGSIADMDVDDPDHVFMTEFDQYDREYLLQLYTVNVGNGVGTPIFHGTKDTIGFLTNGHGQVIGQIDQGDDLINHIYMGGNEVFKYSVKGGREFEIKGLTEGDHPQFAAERVSDYGKTSLYNWNPSGFGAVLFENPTYDMDGTIADERTGRVIGATYTDDLTRAAYFDPGRQRIQATLEKAFPGQSILILSKDDAGSEYVIMAQGPKNPPILYLYTTANHQVNIVEEAYNSLKASDLGDVKPYPYKARDGLDIHAYLTLPPGRNPHNLPTVIFPHGGPEAREFDGFRLVGPIHGVARIRGLAAELSRVCRLRVGFHSRRRRRMGRKSSIRRPRRREKTDRRRNRRSQANLHRRRQLWRLYGTCRRNVFTGPLCLRDQFRRIIGPQSHVLHGNLVRIGECLGLEKAYRRRCGWQQTDLCFACELCRPGENSATTFAQR